jgi:hypothetical protein
MDVHSFEEVTFENVTHAHRVVVWCDQSIMVNQSSLEFQMTKRRTELASKHASEALSKHPNSSQQDALLVEDPEKSLKDGALQMMDDHSKGSFFFTAHTNVLAYQAKLLELAQANMQFALEFLLRLAAIKSPFELPGVMADLTSKRIAMFQKHSAEMMLCNSGDHEISSRH